MKAKIQNSKWWIKIFTKHPACIHYFGPFEDYQKAKNQKEEYIKELEKRKFKINKIEIKRCKPSFWGENHLKSPLEVKYNNNS